ncbi:MAG: Druantia anti-phage system protein DruA, partial [Bryobacteraceae bacterium]
MPVTIGGGLSFCGREVKPEELDLIRQITRDFSTLSLTELAHTVCELLEWRRPNGGLKSRECYLFLQALQERGWLPWLSLQPKKLRPRTTGWDERSDAQTPLSGLIGDYLPVQLQLLDSSEDRRLFRQYIQRYHYLGYKVPYGAQLRYFVRSPQPPRPVLACFLFTSAAWKMAPRDTCIGWNQTARQTNLPLVVNNSRFLILPWVRVPNLASHILSLAAAQLPRDWFAAYGAQPVLLETLVDQTR